MIRKESVSYESERTPLLSSAQQDGENGHLGDPLLDGESLDRQNGVWPMKVLILMSDTGGGHRASANALTDAFKHLYKDNVSVTTVDLWVEIAGWPFSTYPWWYRLVAKYPVAWMFVYWYGKLPPTRWFQEQMWQVMVHDKLKAFLNENQPDVIVSVHPMVNRLTNNVLRRIRCIDMKPTPIFSTVVTDYGDAHPMWFNKDSEVTYIPSEPVRTTAIKFGMENSKLKVYGLALRREFWDDKTDKFGKREKLGLSVSKPVILLMGGGDGMGNLELISEAVARHINKELGPNGAKLVIVCGSNRKLKSTLAHNTWPVEVEVLGFTDNISEWMEASDLLVTKAGPGTIAEAFVKSLPMIIYTYLPGQEEGNMQFVVDNDLGIYSTDAEVIGATASEWLGDPERLAEMRRRTKTFAMPSASIDIARDLGVVYGNTYSSLASRVGLPSEIREEFYDAWTRRSAILVAVILNIVIAYFLFFLLRHLLR